MTLVCLVFSLPGIDFSRATDHAEFFSGKMSVTLGEMEDGSGDDLWMKC